jgi:hypothetical protein
VPRPQSLEQKIFDESVTFDESLKKTLEVKCVNLGMPDKISNGTGLTKFSQICIWFKVLKYFGGKSDFHPKSPLLEIGLTKGGVDK